MAVMYTMTLSPNRQGSKLNITEAAVAAVIGANDIALYVMDSVSLHRQVEIINAWRFLFNGLRDRDIFNQFAKDSPIYSVVDADAISVASRRTSSQFTELLPNDIGIAIGGDITELDARNLPETLIFESAFAMLRDHARERGMLVA